MHPLAFKTFLNTFQNRDELMSFQRPLVMGILNCTPNSFSDGGCFLDRSAAIAHAHAMIAAGADIIDIGGESSKPGAEPVSEADELHRVIPVIEALRQDVDITISIDTTKPAVMRAAVAVGAAMINDILALRSEGALEAAVDLAVPVCLMHMQGTPKTMQQAPHYSAGVIQALHYFFEEQIARCELAGIPRSHIILDPGFAFGKTVGHNLSILKQLSVFKGYGLPILLGVSRKSTLGIVLDKPVDERLIAGIVVAVQASLNGVAMIRTHDVSETKQAIQMIDAIMNAVEESGVE